MRSLLLFVLTVILSVPAYSQLNCSTVNAALSLSASGGVVTLTNSSVPTATSTIYTTYTIKWGDNTTSYAYNNTAQVHTYNTSGTYPVTLYSSVYDSVFNITCNDTATANITVTTSLNCSNVNANMYAYVSGASTGVVVNNSVPVAGPRLSVQYLINWGDGSANTNTSSKNNQTHVYSTSGNYTIKLWVTVHDSNNSITCVDSMADSVSITSSGTLNCNTVNAAFSKTVSGNNLTLINTSMPNPGSGINASYKIYWGDGNTTTKTNKTNTAHYYPNGVYIIKLVATYTQGSVTCKDSTSDSVNIYVAPPNVISGMVVVDSNVVNSTDSIKIWLIKFDSTTNILSAIDSQMKHVYNPFYSFNNKTSGQYRTKAKLINGQTSGTGYVPTYHDSDLTWNTANVINHSGGSSVNKNIYMRTGTVTAGPGFVGGNVSMGANKGTSNGVEGINILLLDAKGDVVAYAVTDANGDYGFSNLPSANYTVHPEDLGYTTTAATLIVTPGQPVHNGINFERSLSQHTITPKATGISNINNKQLEFAVYPNPANDVVNVNWASYTDDAAAITITDISGKKVYSSEIRMNINAAININKLQTGFYFLTVVTEFGTNTKKLVVE